MSKLRIRKGRQSYLHELTSILSKSMKAIETDTASEVRGSENASFASQAQSQIPQRKQRRLTHWPQYGEYVMDEGPRRKMGEMLREMRSLTE